MTGYLTGQQEIEQFKGWWKAYGINTLALFLIAFLSGLGWHFWLKHRENKLARGSTHYEELLSAVINNDQTIAMKQAALLKNNYAGTPYGALAALMIARNDIYQNNYSDAEKELKWVITNANTSSLKQAAQLRLARLYIEQKKAGQSLEVLNKVNNIAYMPMIDEIKGDSYLALNQINKARMFYQQSLHSMQGYAVMRPVLVMKVDNLASPSGISP